MMTLYGSMKIPKQPSIDKMGRMRRNEKRLSLAAIWFATMCSMPPASRAQHADDEHLSQWHQWRGPLATGFAPLGDPPIHWDENTNIKWKVPLPGRGTCTPVIWGNRIFILTAIETDREAEPAPEAEDRAGSGDPRTTRGEARGGRKSPMHYVQFAVLCLDRETGSVLWQDVAAEVVPHEGHHPTNSFAAASPVTDGHYVYCWFGSRGLYCYDMEGNRAWQADLGDFEIKYGFGEGSSPALHEDTLVVKCDHEGESFITALSAVTGRPKWKTIRDEQSTWNTPLVAPRLALQDAAGGKERLQVIVTGARSTQGYDFQTGEPIWQYPGRPGVDAIPSPLRLDDLAICTSGFRGDPAYAVPLDSFGELTDESIEWKHTEGTPQISTPALVGERLYFIKGRGGIVTCLNARTGEVIIDQERLPGLDDIYASPVAAAGRVYFTDRDGTTVVIDAAADEVRVLSENQLDESTHGSPAIAGGEIFIRGETHLYCIAE
jgi:outer membrane protein assembly factor BamB